MKVLWTEEQGVPDLMSRFKPDFPAASPFITAVGGTDLKTAGVIGAETTWKDGGGGFSATFVIPDYQVGFRPRLTSGTGPVEVVLPSRFVLRRAAGAQTTVPYIGRK